MIRVTDTVHDRMGWPCPVPKELLGSVGSLRACFDSLGVEYRFEELPYGRCTLWVDPRAYHWARAIVWQTIPAFVHVNIIPLEV